MSKSTRARQEPTPHVDLEYPSSVPTFTVNPTQLSSSSSPLPWFSAFGRKDANAPLPSEIDPKYSDPAYYASASTYGKNGRNTSHTAKKPDGHIKRPPNCFLLFRSHVKESGIRIPDALKPIIRDRLRDKRKEQKAKTGRPGSDDEDDDDDDDDNDDDEQSVSKISGILWDFLPAAEKSFFRARAAHAKAMHKKLYPNYKYSPQVKDKTVKRRVGKKMAPEKRERLEEVATVLVKEMGWATGDVAVKRSATPSSSSTSKFSPSQQGIELPGTSAFGVPGYEHHHPHKMGSAPPNGSSAASSSTPYGVPVDSARRMERRTSSCPPPDAHLAWADPSAVQTHTPPAYPPPPPHQMYPPQSQWYPPQPQPVYPFQHPQPVPPVAGTYVRPGGKTVRKMRTGPSASAKTQVLNGKGNVKKSNTMPTPHQNVGGAMTLPSLPSVMKSTTSEVPMTTGAGASPAPYEHVPHSVDVSWGLGPQHYDQSQHSSPQTFSSSAPASLLETPPFPHYVHQHPQAQMYDFPNPQSYHQQPQVAVPSAPFSAPGYVPQEEAAEGGELGLTMIDQNYTFPPMAPSPSGSPRSGSPPKAPSQRDQRKWTKPHHHSPMGNPSSRKVPRLNTNSPPTQSETSPYTPVPSSAVSNAPTLLSPTPVTPISSMSLHHQAQQPLPQSLDNLGVDLNLNMPTGHEVLEFHFPAQQGGASNDLFQDAYGLLGGANPNVLLGDVALGMHEDEQQAGQQDQGNYAQYTPQYVEGYSAGPEAGSYGPLDVPLDALYGGHEEGASGPGSMPEFDPSSFVVGVDLTAAASEEMTSTQQLEYEMMEWRRGSDNTVTGGPSRRASVSVGMALGGEVGVALYGYEASAAAYEPSSPAYGLQVAGAEFDFQAPPAPHQQVPYSLSAVPEGEERGSSEEAEDGSRYPPAPMRGHGWVASSA